MSDREQRLLEYALGVLDKDASDTLTRELQRSPTLRRALTEIEESLAMVAVAESPIKPSDDLKSRMLASLEPNTRLEGYKARFGELFDLAGERVVELLDLAKDVATEPWETCPIPGTRLFYFAGGPRVSRATCGFVHMEAGRIFPAHRHRGDEWVLVLSGYAIEHSGRMFEPGDIIFSAKGSRHSFRVLDEEPLLFAVVLEQPNQWLLGRSVLDRIFARRRFRKPI